jgi:hypothetical protein
VRKVILNAMLWIAHAEVPAGGVESNPSDLELNGMLRSRINPDGTPGEGTPVSMDPKQAKFASPLVTAGTTDIDVDITGAKQLHLVVTDGGNGHTGRLDSCGCQRGASQEVPRWVTVAHGAGHHWQQHHTLQENLAQDP